MVVTPRLTALIRPDHPVQWRTASPLWRLAGPTDNAVLLRPALLRFTTDTFMEDFLTVAIRSPNRLGEWKAQKETWRKPAPVPLVPPAQASLFPAAEILDPELESQPLKLFQPAHQRYYLVTANLVCRIPGLPDRTLKTNNDEQVSFVLRRFLRPKGENVPQEHALVNGVWQLLDSAQEQTLLPGEQQFSMFPTTYTETNGYQRRLFAGLVPVSARETYMNAARQVPTPAPEDAAAITKSCIEQLLTVLEMDVTEPWRAINRLKTLEDNKLLESWQEIATENDLVGLNQARDKLQTSSWYVLLDFAYYLERYLPRLWAQLLVSPNGSIPTDLPGRSLLANLQSRTYKPSSSTNNSLTLDNLQNRLRGVDDVAGSTTLTNALKSVYEKQIDLERLTTTYTEPAPGDWPTTRFLLCGRRVADLVDSLKGLVETALTEDPSALAKRLPLVPISQQISGTAQNTDYQDDLFVIRCVFQRPHCPPSLQPTVVSQPTEQFQMASYFDPDAPARPIRIPMPVDTSPAGLRKFAKNTAFVISDSLSCQIEKARSLTFGDLVLSVLPWPFRKNLDTSGAGATCNNKANSRLKCNTCSNPLAAMDLRLSL